MRNKGRIFLLSISMVLTLCLVPESARAGLDAPIDLSNPRIVPLFVKDKGGKPSASLEAAYSGFLYSSRIVFSAAHSEYYFNNDGTIVNRAPGEIYVGLPNSKPTDITGQVRVIKRIISKTYRMDNATLDDIVIYVLEKDLIQAEPVALLTPEIEKELIASRAEIKMHGYGEYRDRCRPGENLPCSKKDLKTEQPRSLSAFLRTLQDAESIVGYKRPQLAEHLIITNGKPGFGCGGDSGGSITTIYKGNLMYLGPTPNGMNGYACGATDRDDGFGGINYSTPIYKHGEILREAEEFVAKQIDLEKAAADKAAADKAAADKAAADKAAADKAAADKAAADKAAADKAAADKAKQQSTTIICKKGKVKKKITAISPQCPKGFKKK
jgi:hypothetical protein